VLVAALQRTAELELASLGTLHECRSAGRLHDKHHACNN
jgi:hypothetical protein